MRHRQRHLHYTILKHLREELALLGWTSGDGNFGSPLVTFLDYEPIEAGKTPALNTVAVSMGDQGEDTAFEMGGGMYECRYTVFVDIYPSNEAIGAALGDDIKDSLTDEVLPLLDFTSSADGVETTAQIEFESVLVEVIPTATTTLDKRSWRAVKATAILYYFPGVTTTPPPDPDPDPDPDPGPGPDPDPTPTPTDTLEGDLVLATAAEKIALRQTLIGAFDASAHTLRYSIEEATETPFKQEGTQNLFVCQRDGVYSISLMFDYAGIGSQSYGTQEIGFLQFDTHYNVVANFGTMVTIDAETGGSSRYGGGTLADSEVTMAVSAGESLNLGTASIQGKNVGDTFLEGVGQARVILQVTPVLLAPLP